jgi:hypothetical protein
MVIPFSSRQVLYLVFVDGHGLVFDRLKKTCYSMYARSASIPRVYCSTAKGTDTFSRACFFDPMLEVEANGETQSDPRTVKVEFPASCLIASGVGTGSHEWRYLRVLAQDA